MTNLLDLNIGDPVLVQGHDWSYTKHAIAKKTATQVVLEDGSRWLGRGRRVGDTDSWSWSAAYPWDDGSQKLIDDSKLKKDRYRLRQQLDSAVLTREQVDEIFAILQQKYESQP